jgi:hypothetical protein
MAEKKGVIELDEGGECVNVYRHAVLYFVAWVNISSRIKTPMEQHLR